MSRFAIKLIFFLLLTNNTFCQQFENWFHFNSNGDFNISNIVEGENGSSYITGSFTGSFQSIFSKGQRDIYLAKVNNNKELVWFRQIGGKNMDIFPDIVFASNSVFLIGALTDTVYIDDNDTLIMSSSFRDMALIRYDLNGNLVFAKKIAFGPNHVNSRSVTVDNNNDLVLVGDYIGSVQFQNESFTNPGRNHFILKVDINGNQLWVKSITGNNNSTTFTNVIAYDDGYFFNGYFRDVLNFDVGSISSFAANIADLFLYKTDLNGNGQWVRRSYGNNHDVSGSLTSDLYGNVYFSGYTRSSVLTFDSIQTNQSLNPYTNNGNTDIFIVKYNKNGVLQWVRGYGSPRSEYAVNIEERYNFLYLSGYYTGELVFEQDTLTGNSINDTNMFIGTFDLGGNMLKAVHLQGSDSRRDISNAIYVDASNNVYLAGNFQSAGLWVGTILINNGYPGNYDGVIARYTPPYSAVFTGVTDPSCFGENNGRLQVTPYFGVPPFTYTWSHAPHAGIADSVANGLTAGLYTVIVRDALGRDAEANINLTQPSALNTTGNITHVNCPNGQNGAIDITVTGGVQPYSYIWVSTDGGTGIVPTTQDQTGITSGTYLVTVTDNNLCQRTDTFVVTQPAPFRFGQSQVTHVTIPPGSNGTIDLVVTGGTQPYGYLWQGPALYSSTNASISGLDGGNYMLTVTDNHGCTGDTSFLIIDETILILQLTSKTDVTCKDANNGEANIAVLHGTAPYTYKWSDQDAFVSSTATATRTPMTGGNYVLDVTDADLKSASINVRINQPEFALLVVPDAQGLKCYNDSSGVVDLTVTGGTLPYSYNWGAAGTNEDLVNVTAGNYSVIVTDANGCNETEGVNVTNAPQMFLSVSPDPVFRNFCYGDLNASANAVASGGTSPLSYLWNDQAGQITPTATLLPAGTFTVKVTDAEGCYLTGQVIIPHPSEIRVTEVLYFEPTCHGLATGQIAPTITGGTLPRNYLWVDVGHNQQEISSIPGGDYTLRVRDNNDCVKHFNFTLDQPDAISFVNRSTTDVLCFGQANGTISIDLIGGTTPYSYNWSTTSGSGHSDGIKNQSNLRVGSYFLDVADDNSCHLLDTFTIDQPQQISFANSSITEVIMPPGINGAIEAGVSGGVSPYSYAWEGVAGFVSTDEDINGLYGGNYSLTITDFSGCSNDTVFQVNDPTDFRIELTNKTDIICPGDDNGSLSVEVFNGTLPLTYNWADLSEFVTNETTQQRTPLDGGTYSLEVTDAHYRTSQLSVPIIEPGPLSMAVITVTNASCFSYEDGSITILAAGGTPSYRYSINGGGTYANSPAFSVGAGIYTLALRDTNNCVAADSVVSISEPPGIEILSEEWKDITCFGASDGSIIVNATGGAGNLRYSTVDGDPFFVNSGIFTNLGGGFYPVKVIDNDGCMVSGTYISLPGPAPILVDTVSVIQPENGSPGTISLSSTGGQGTLTWVLKPELADSITGQSPQFGNLAQGSYTIYATDTARCVSNLLDISLILREGDLIIYDAFSPNADGVNDVWNIGNITKYPDCVVIVYNAWGNKVFESNGYTEPWDGIYNGRPLPSGTYYYIIDLGDGSNMLSGPVNIVK